MLGYRFGPLRLASTTALPELGAGQLARAGAWRFELSRAARAEPVRGGRSWAFPDGRRWATIGAVDAGWVVRFERTASFRIDTAARRIVARRHRHVPLGTVRHLLLDQVLPLVIAEGRHLVVHASAVAIGGGAVAFVGESGSGKSTVAAACATHGHALVSDDCFVVAVDSRPAMAVPACAGLRLWPDAVAALFAGDAEGAPVAHYTVKRRLGGAGPGRAIRSRPLPVRAVCVLERGHVRSVPALTRLRGQEAFAALLRCTFQLDTGRGASARALDRVAALLERSPAYRLRLPRRFACLPAVPALVASIAVG